MAIFFRSCSFVAERDEPELILVIYVVSVQLRSAPKRPFLARLSPRRGYQVPSSVEPACGATKSQLRQPPRTGRKEKKNAKYGAIRVLSLHYFCFACFCMLALLCICMLTVEQVNERKLVGAWCMEKLR
jgi:hypothetical protein